MIIPNFKCDQDGKFVYLTIKAINSRLERTEFDLNENIVIFTSPPYHLRLNLPGSVIVNEDEDNCKWNCDTNEFVLKLKKLNENEHFDGLDLVSKLLAIPTEDELRKKKLNLIELVDQVNVDDSNVDNSNVDEDEDLFSFKFDLNESNRSILNTNFNYGFLNCYSSVIERYQDELWQLTDNRNPGELSANERRGERLKKEAADFNEEHYLFDQYENNKFIDNLRLAKSVWLDKHESFELSEDEVFRLKNLPKKEFKLKKDEKLIALYTLIDVLYAYCYDKRINEGDQSTESAWNISKLSSTFSWFDTFHQIDDVLQACLRRSLCYPLFRNYELSKSVLSDLIKLLNNGNLYVIKCLLEMHQLLNQYGDFKYLLNDLFVNDLLIAIQYLDKKYFTRLANLIETKLSAINKCNLDFDLILLDEAAKSTILDQIECLNC